MDREIVLGLLDSLHTLLQSVKLKAVERNDEEDVNALATVTDRVTQVQRLLS